MAASSGSHRAAASISVWRDDEDNPLSTATARASAPSRSSRASHALAYSRSTASSPSSSPSTTPTSFSSRLQSLIAAEEPACVHQFSSSAIAFEERLACCASHTPTSAVIVPCYPLRSPDSSRIDEQQARVIATSTSSNHSGGPKSQREHVQRELIHCVQHMRKEATPFFPSLLPVGLESKTLTGKISPIRSAIARAIMGRPLPSSPRLEEALLTYHRTVNALNSMWNESRLYLHDEESSSASSLVAFSFMSFDSQLFNVGRSSVIACAQLLCAVQHDLMFSDEDLSDALLSVSPGKELMQSQPQEIPLWVLKQQPTVLASSTSFQNRGERAQELLLHHLALTSCLSARTDSSALLQTVTPSCNLIAWSEILQAVSSSSNSPNANKRLLANNLQVAYIAQPTRDELLEIVRCYESFPQRDQPFTSFPRADRVANPCHKPSALERQARDHLISEACSSHISTVFPAAPMLTLQMRVLVDVSGFVPLIRFILCRRQVALSLFIQIVSNERASADQSASSQLLLTAQEEMQRILLSWNMLDGMLHRSHCVRRNDSSLSCASRQGLEPTVPLNDLAHPIQGKSMTNSYMDHKLVDGTCFSVHALSHSSIAQDEIDQGHNAMNPVYTANEGRLKFKLEDSVSLEESTDDATSDSLSLSFSGSREYHSAADEDDLFPPNFVSDESEAEA